MLEQEVRKQIINNVVGNFLGHGGITYWIKHELPEISAGGKEGYIADFLVTGFLFPFILGAIYVFMMRRKVARGDLEWNPARATLTLPWLPAGPWKASSLIGLIGLVSVAVPLGIFLLIAGIGPLSPEAVSLSKGIWAAIAAGLIVPVASYHGARIAK